MTLKLLSERKYEQLSGMCYGYADRINLLLDDELTRFQLTKLLDMLRLISTLNLYLQNLKLFQESHKMQQVISATIKVGTLVDTLIFDEEELKKVNIYLEVQ